MTEPTIKSTDHLVEETRRHIQPYVFERLKSRSPRVPGKKIARTITVTSGKGGVGKTNVVANLAICLGQAGRQVTILDADLGLANIDVVFGIRPKKNLNDVINGTLDLEQILIPGPCGVQIVAGGSGISELAQLNPSLARKLFDQLRFLEDKTDYLLIDTGAGISANVVSFCLAADQIIVVTTPEPTALADAYGIIKVIWQSKPQAQVSILVNRVESPEEGEFILERLEKVSMDFLQFPVRRLGYIPQDRNMYLAVRQQTPLMLFSPMSPAAVSLRGIVTGFFNEQFPEAEVSAGNQDSFFVRLSRLFAGDSRA